MISYLRDKFKGTVADKIAQQASCPHDHYADHKHLNGTITRICVRCNKSTHYPYTKAQVPSLQPGVIIPVDDPQGSIGGWTSPVSQQANQVTSMSYAVEAIGGVAGAAGASEDDYEWEWQWEPSAYSPNGSMVKAKVKKKVPVIKELKVIDTHGFSEDKGRMFRPDPLDI